MRPGVDVMDKEYREFLKQRAAYCRFLAENADPFIRRRLLDLAARYEASLRKPSQASVILDDTGRATGTIPPS